MLIEQEYDGGVSTTSVSLLPVMNKIAECNILRGLKESTQDLGILQRTQMGFATFNWNMKTAFLFLYVVQAYDLVWHDGVVQKVGSLG